MLRLLGETIAGVDLTTIAPTKTLQHNDADYSLVFQPSIAWNHFMI